MDREKGEVICWVAYKMLCPDQKESKEHQKVLITSGGALNRKGYEEIEELLHYNKCRSLIKERGNERRKGQTRFKMNVYLLHNNLDRYFGS